jgi:hypothetical protein
MKFFESGAHFEKHEGWWRLVMHPARRSGGMAIPDAINVDLWLC